MGRFGGIKSFFSSVFSGSADTGNSLDNDGSDDDEYFDHHSDTGMDRARSAKKAREAGTTFNLADIRIPKERRVMDAEHVWQQEFIPGYGGQSDLYTSSAYLRMRLPRQGKDFSMPSTMTTHANSRNPTRLPLKPLLIWG